MNRAACITILALASTAAIKSQTAVPTPTPPPGAVQPLDRPSPTSPVSPTTGATTAGSAAAAQMVPGVVAINLGTGQPVSASDWAAAAAASTNMQQLPGPRTGALRPAAPAATRSNITPAQLQNINQIDIALNALGLPGRDASGQQRAFTQTLQAAPLARVKPSPDAIAKLGSTLATVVPTLNLTAPQRRQLAIDLNLALNSGNLTSGEAERVIRDARALLQGSTVNNGPGVEQLMGNLTAVVSQAQASVAGGNAAGTTLPGSPAATQAGRSAENQTGAGGGSSTSGGPEPVAPHPDAGGTK